MLHIVEMNRQDILSLLTRARYWIDFFGPRRLISGVVTGVAGVVLLWLVLRPSPTPVESLLPVATFPPTSSTVAQSPLTVHVAGAVHSPGVYRLPPRSRVVDALAAAGGPLQKADLERINLAQILVDTEQVYIPTHIARTPAPTIAPRHRPTTTIASPSSTPSGAPGSSGLVDLNTATAAQLDVLPGVGPATAKAILDYRESKGKFSKVEDLMNVAGIGATKFAALKDLVMVSS